MKNWKDLIIEDQLRTIERLNEELKNRMKYEKELIQIIAKYQGDIREEI